MNDTMTLAERADALEHRMMCDLDAIIVKSRLFSLADGDTSTANGPALLAANPGKYMLMGDDPRLTKMPRQPTLMDFFKYRFGPANHLLQSARHAVRAGMDEKVVLACLLHDIGVIGFIRADHGYWGAQMVAPYVDEEVGRACRARGVHRCYRPQLPSAARRAGLGQQPVRAYVAHLDPTDSLFVRERQRACPVSRFA